MGKIIPFKLNRNRKGKAEEKPKEEVPSVAEQVAQLRLQLEAIERLAEQKAAEQQLPSFMEFERALKESLNAVGRAATELLLTHAEERVAAACKDGVQCGERFLCPAPKLQARNLTCEFGVVRYFRTYLRENHEGKRRGFHPLDMALGLVADRFSWSVLSVGARLATKMSFAEAKATMGLFLPNAPSTEVIEQTVLGLGKFTQQWFADLPAPEGDGEVLVIMIDSKGAPTATDEELRRRRGKRRRDVTAASRRSALARPDQPLDLCFLRPQGTRLPDRSPRGGQARIWSGVRAARPVGDRWGPRSGLLRQALLPRGDSHHRRHARHRETLDGRRVHPYRGLTRVEAVGRAPEEAPLWWPSSRDRRRVAEAG